MKGMIARPDCETRRIDGKGEFLYARIDCDIEPRTRQDGRNLTRLLGDFSPNNARNVEKRTRAVPIKDHWNDRESTDKVATDCQSRFMFKVLPFGATVSSVVESDIGRTRQRFAEAFKPGIVKANPIAQKIPERFKPQPLTKNANRTCSGQSVRYFASGETVTIERIDIGDVDSNRVGSGEDPSQARTNRNDVLLFGLVVFQVSEDCGKLDVVSQSPVEPM